MPILDVEQPDIIVISDKLRLKKFNGVLNFALPWYRDPHTLYMLDGPDWAPYDITGLIGMFEYLEQHGECYIIEHLMGKYFEPIGDITYWKDDIPLVIGNPDYRGKGIGKAVVSALLARGKELGYTQQKVGDIYDYNDASIALFTSLGFVKDEKTSLGYSYKLDLV